MTDISRPVLAVDDNNADITKSAAANPVLQPVLHQPLDGCMDRAQMRDALTEAFRAAGFKIVPGSLNVSKRQQSY